MKLELGAGIVSLVDRWTGTEARLLRQALRLSMRGFAEHLGIAARTVAKWESGGPDINPRPDSQAILDAALSRADPDAQARFDALLTRIRQAPSEGVRRPRSLPSGPIEQADYEEPDDPHSEVVGDVGVRRREFIGTAAVAALALRVGPIDAPSRITDATVSPLKSRLVRLRKLDEHLGGGDTYPLYLSEFQSTEALARRANYAEKTGKTLLSVMGEQAQQAGWAAFDAGWQSEAARLYELSLAVAEEADDSSLRGSALAFLAYQQACTARGGVELAEQSCRVAGGRAHPAIRALLHERLAWACAVAGHATKTAEALERAHEASNHPADEPPPDWAAWVDPTELEILEGVVGWHCTNHFERSECWNECSRGTTIGTRATKRYTSSR
jgi:transcriptional regulator with XRE-family HTH domain